MLVALGHEPLPAIVTLVLLNCLVSHLGTVGMMIWFGFGSLNLGDPNLVRIAAKSAVIIGLPTFFVAPLAASFLCPWRDLRRAWLFVLLSVASAIGPTVAVAQFNHDVPIVVGEQRGWEGGGLRVRGRICHACPPALRRSAARFGAGNRVGAGAAAAIGGRTSDLLFPFIGLIGHRAAAPSPPKHKQAACAASW